MGCKKWVKLFNLESDNNNSSDFSVGEELVAEVGYELAEAEESEKDDKKLVANSADLNGASGKVSTVIYQCEGGSANFTSYGSTIIFNNKCFLYFLGV